MQLTHRFGQKQQDTQACCTWFILVPSTSFVYTQCLDLDAGLAVPFFFRGQVSHDRLHKKRKKNPSSKAPIIDANALFISLQKHNSSTSIHRQDCASPGHKNSELICAIWSGTVHETTASLKIEHEAPGCPASQLLPLRLRIPIGRLHRTEGDTRHRPAFLRPAAAAAAAASRSRWHGGGHV